MSNNAPQTQQTKNDILTPKQEHRGFWYAHKVGRGKKRHWEFRGRQPDEKVKKVLRKSKVFLITPAIPFVASLLGLIIVGALFGTNPGGDSFWLLLEVIMLALVIITGVYFAYHDLALWWVETYIITNKRVLIWKGLLTPSRDEFGVDKVVQVATDQTGLISLLLNYGNVHLYLVGGKEPILERVHDPKGVRDIFEKITDEYNKPDETKPQEETPDIKNRPVKDALKQLSDKKEKIKPLDDVDEKKHPGYRQTKKVLGPLKTFGGPLHLPCNVKYTQDEYTVEYIQRAKSVLVGKLIIPTLIFLGLIISLFYFPPLDAYIGLAIIGMFFVFAYIIINYFDDIYILTNKRIIDINRRFIFLDEEHLLIEYSNIKSVQVKMSNPLYIAMNVGKVIVETPGENPNIEMRVVDNPFRIQDKIYEVKGHKEKVDKIKEANARIDQLNQWFSTIISTMEQNALSKGVPSLHNLDLFKAAERAHSVGMKVVPVGESSSYPNIPPGLIVSQDPMPGIMVDTTGNNGKPEIHVILSKRP